MKINCLTEEEAKRPYAKYFTWKHGGDDPEAMAAYEKDEWIDPALCTTIDKRNDLIKPGYLPMEFGVCELPDGTGVIANRIKMPLVRPEMFAWYLCWFGFDDVRYKIWWPETHFGVHMDQAFKDLMCNPHRLYCHKLRNTSRTIREDMGNGEEEIKMTYATPAEFGFDMTQYPKEPEGGFSSIVLGGNVDAPFQNLLCHYFRPLPEGGCELRTRFWLGYKLENGEAVRAMPDGFRVPRQVMRHMWHHNIQEFSRMRDLLPLIYAEYGSLPLTYGL